MNSIVQKLANSKSYSINNTIYQGDQQRAVTFLSDDKRKNSEHKRLIGEGCRARVHGILFLEFLT